MIVHLAADARCSLLLIPVGVALYLVRRAPPAAPAGRLPGDRSAGDRPASRRRHRRVGCAAGCRPRSCSSGLAVLGRRAGAAAGRRQRPARRGHGHPRRSTCRAAWPPPTCRRPDGGGQGGRPRVRRPAAADRSGSGSSPSATAGSRSRSRPTTGQVAGRDRPARPRNAARRSARGILTVARDDRRGRRRPGGRLLHEPLARADRRADAGPAGSYTLARSIVLLSDGENTTSARIRSRPPRPRPTAASGSSRSGSAAPPGRRSRSRASRSTASSTRRLLAPDRRPHRRHLLRGARPGRADRDLRRHRHPPRHPTGDDGGHLARGRAPACSSCSSVGAVARCAGSGGCHDPSTGPARRSAR